jgi:hypothetical protein
MLLQARKIRIAVGALRDREYQLKRFINLHRIPVNIDQYLGCNLLQARHKQ